MQFQVQTYLSTPATFSNAGAPQSLAPVDKSQAEL